MKRIKQRFTGIIRRRMLILRHFEPSVMLPRVVALIPADAKEPSHRIHRRQVVLRACCPCTAQANNKTQRHNFFQHDDSFLRIPTARTRRSINANCFAPFDRLRQQQTQVLPLQRLQASI